MSRPNAEIKGKLAGKKPPEGPAFRLLQAAYALASVRQHVMPSGAETVYKVVRIARGESFKKQIVQCRLHPWVGEPNPELSLSWTVAAHPSQCAILFAEAVKARGGEPI